MAGHGNPQPRYTLYVRIRDGIMRLIDEAGNIVRIAYWHLVHSEVAVGVFIKLVDAISVIIFDHEFVRVEEFPGDVEVVSGEKTTAKLVAITKEPTLVV